MKKHLKGITLRMGKNAKEKRQKRSLPLWAVFMLPCISVAILYFLLKDRYFEGTSQMSDLIIDQIAMEGSNKTGELDLFWMLLWIGCFLILGLFLIGKSFFRTVSASQLTKTLNPKASSQDTSVSYQDLPGLYQCILCFFPPVLQLIFYGKTSVYLWLFSAVFSFIILFMKENAYSFAALFLFLYFDIQAIGVIAALTTGRYLSYDILIFAAAAVLFTLILLLHFHFYGLFQKILFVSQLPLPLLLLLYTKNSYSYQGETFRLAYPKTYLLFIGLLIIVLYGVFLVQFRFTFGRSKSFISVTSAISIFLYGSYIPSALMVQTDMHHHGEQMLPWQQIMVLNSSAYESYSPVSGLFPMVIGGINQLFFGGKATTYAAAFTILFIIFALLTIVMIYLHAGGKWTLLFGFLFHMPVYCRTWIILPVLLFLCLPGIIKNKRRFLYLYVFCGFLSGLYYPLFGLALIVAGMPFALFQLYSYIKDKELLRDVKQKVFYGETLLLLVPILLAIPLLTKMAAHILAYSHQTILADGLSLSSISLPDWFMPYLAPISGVRCGLYYAVRFLGSMIPVWLFLLLLLSYIYQNKDRTPFGQPAFLGLSAGFLLLPVCYTYTLVIMDESWVSRLFSRSSHVYLWILGIFLPILLIRYGKQILQRSSSIIVLTALSISIPFLTFYEMGDYEFPAMDGTTNAESACVGEYTANLLPFPISPTAVPINEDDMSAFPQLGYGFMEGSVRDQLYIYHDNLAILHKADPDLKILGLDSQQMYYFLLNERALYSGKVSLAKSREASESVISQIDEHTVIGSDLRPLNNYYIYDYLLEQGYAYDSVTGFYLPKDLYISMYGNENYHEASLSDSPWAAPVYISKCALTLGSNLESLSPILQPSDDPSEFLYTEIDLEALNARFGNSLHEDSIMTISWEGKGCILTDLCNGRLLLPLASNAAWATGSYREIYISPYDETKPVAEIDVKVPLNEVSNCLQYYSLAE